MSLYPIKEACCAVQTPSELYKELLTKIDIGGNSPCPLSKRSRIRLSRLEYRAIFVKKKFILCAPHSNRN